LEETSDNAITLLGDSRQDSGYDGRACLRRGMGRP
jgi:hypothetical protein